MQTNDKKLLLLLTPLFGLLIWTSLSDLEISGRLILSPEHSNSFSRQLIDGRERKPSIFCLILSLDTPINNEQSEAVRKTWARRCDEMLIVKNGTKLGERNGTLTLPIEHESREMLWKKVAASLGYLYATRLNRFDWFMKADDDTYVLIDSLRQFLGKKSAPNEAVYYGYKFRPYVRQGYMSGGSGYVLSRRALQLLIEKGFKLTTTTKDDNYNATKDDSHLAGPPPACPLPADASSIEDLEIGRCLESVGVAAGDSRDPFGRPTFLALSPVQLLRERQLTNADWYYNYAFYGPPKSGKQCCSSRPISFHYIDPGLMYLIDWLLYDVKR